jgi:hypothetical protein
VLGMLIRIMLAAAVVTLTQAYGMYDGTYRAT